MIQVHVVEHHALRNNALKCTFNPEPHQSFGSLRDVVAVASAWSHSLISLLFLGTTIITIPLAEGGDWKGIMCALRFVSFLDDLGSWIISYFGSNGCSNLQPTFEEIVIFYRAMVFKLYHAQNPLEDSLKQRFPGFHPRACGSMDGVKESIFLSSSQVMVILLIQGQHFENH